MPGVFRRPLAAGACNHDAIAERSERPRNGERRPIIADQQNTGACIIPVDLHICTSAGAR